MAVVTIIAKQWLNPVGRLYMKKLVNAAENAFTDRSIMLGENEELVSAGKRVCVSIGQKKWEILLR